MNSQHYDVKALSIHVGFDTLHLEPRQLSSLDNALCTVKSERTYKSDVGAFNAARKQYFTLNNSSVMTTHIYIARLHDGTYIYILTFNLRYGFEISSSDLTI